MTADSTLLRVRGLTTTYRTRHRVIRAVDEVSFDLRQGEVLGLVGESGCGKSATALSLTRLIPESQGTVEAAELTFDGGNLLALSDEQMRDVRGRRIGFIFQDPMTSLNPSFTVGHQVAESTRRHLGLTRRQARTRAEELLARVGIPQPGKRMNDYPHQFSGGMRQRVMIAIAISCDPVLLLADEPTTALDVTVQAQILDLIKSLADELRTAVILITHDLGVAAGMCHRVNVMYAGQIVESGPVDEIFERPATPYTIGLLGSLPRLTDEEGARLRAIEGLPPDLARLPEGCRFSPRCAYRRDTCGTVPELTARADDSHRARCWATEPGGWI